MSAYPLSAFQHFSISGFTAFAVLAYLWFRVIDHLRIEWSLNEQYAYGWAVPFLCALLLYRRCRLHPSLPTDHRPLTTDFRPLPSEEGSAGVSPADFSVSPKPSSNTSSSASLRLCGKFSAFQLFSFSVFLLLSFLATRLVEIANPDWRFVSWGLALTVISISLAFLCLLGGSANARHFAFPIVFFLVAVPWPTVIEHPAVQFLTRGIVAVTVEILNIRGVIAVPHGNVIETANGFVDVDEACSGIRSLQAALMLALFFGEWHRLSVRNRFILAGAALGLACLFNLARTVVLSFVAAKQGSPAVGQWHDPAGIIILLGCFTGVWLLAAWLAKRNAETLKTETLKSEGNAGDPPAGFGVSPKPAVPPSDLRPRTPTSPRFQLSTLNPPPASYFVALAVTLLLGEIAVWAWYHSAAPASVPVWNVSLPEKNPTLKETELPANTVRMLRFTGGNSAKWENADGTQWQFFYFRWAPGRAALNLARNHTPEGCLPAAGHKLRIIHSPTRVEIGDVSISFRSFVAGSVERPLYVFYSLWEDGAIEQHSEAQSLTVESRLNAVKERRRNPGQRVVEIAISGARDLAQAEASLGTELPKLIQITLGKN